MTTKGQSLLSGNIFCGHCGSRLTFSPDTNRYSKKSGEVVSYNVAGYVCKHGATIGGSVCQQKYIAKRVDDTVRSILQQVFAQIRELPPTDTWERQHERQLSDNRNKVKTATRNASKLDKELSAYKK